MTGSSQGPLSLRRVCGPCEVWVRSAKWLGWGGPDVLGFGGDGAPRPGRLRMPPGVSHPVRGVLLRGARWAGVVGAAAGRWALSARRARSARRALSARRAPSARRARRLPRAKVSSGPGVQQGGPAATGSEQGHPAAMRTWPGHGGAAEARLVTPPVEPVIASSGATGTPAPLWHHSRRSCEPTVNCRTL